MDFARFQVRTLATAGCAVLLGSGATAQEVGATPAFAAPKRLQAGDAFLGEGRLYPSPAVHDVDGDGRADIVIGDLVGRITYAPRSNQGSAPVLGAEKQLKDRSGEQLKFHNW
jgi:hypothetical protein